MNYYKVNQVVTLFSAAIPNAILLLEHTQKHPATWYSTNDLANAFFSIPIPKTYQKHFSFSWKGQKHTFNVLPQWNVSSLSLCVNSDIRDLDHFSLPRDTSLVHHINDIMQIELSEQELQPLYIYW